MLNFGNMGVGTTILLIVAIGAGFVAGRLAQDRGGNFLGYFALGFLMPVIGIPLALLLHHEHLADSEQPLPAPKVGWHRDPTGRFDFRYFDRSWTDRVMRLDGREFEDSL